MNRILGLLLAFYGVLFSQTTFAYKGVDFNSVTGILNVPTVKIGDRWYHNLQVKVDQAHILSYTATSSSAGLPETCSGTFKQSQLDAIKSDMTLDKINTLLGCQHLPLYSSEPITIGAPEQAYLIVYWLASGSSYIAVMFSRDGTQIQPIETATNSQYFKFGAFLTQD